MDYIKGAALPNFTDHWRNPDGTTIDFSTGFTFTGKLYDPQNEVLWFTKTTGISGASTNPNLTVQWDATELNINPGMYLFYITANRTADSKKYITSYEIQISDNGNATVYIPEPDLYGAPEGGTTDQVLAKQTNDDGDFYWRTVTDGVDGTDGDSAYEVWINAGNVGTQQDFLDSLVGQDGADGTDGEGVAAGGTANQILVKQSGTDYDTGWEDLIVETGKPTDKYAISNTESGATYKYYGFEDKDGNWYILRKTIATNVYLYTAGASNYATGWTDRATHTYQSYEDTF